MKHRLFLLATIILFISCNSEKKYNSETIRFNNLWNSPFRVSKTYCHQLVNEKGQFLYILNKTAWEGAFYNKVLGYDLWPWKGTCSKPDYMSSTWVWDDMHDSGGAVMTYTLAQGSHTLVIANREDGTKLDRLYVTAQGDTPSGLGGGPPLTAKDQGYYFPPPGEGLAQQASRTPAEVGLLPGIVTALRGRAPAFALWRHGYLAHLEGNFNETVHVASLRKTWHAMIVGAAIEQGKINGVNAEVKAYLPELSGLDAKATWWHLVTQSTGFDYPYSGHPDYEPGQMWTYSDLNARGLTNALARLYGKTGFEDDYAGVARAAYFDAIGLRGWQVNMRDDGALFSFDLEDMGRLGLLALARGEWDGKTVVPQTFVEQLERKQTQGMKVNYDGPNDGRVNLYEASAAFPEVPYGYMTWTNTDGDYYPGADRGWAWGFGNGGHVIMWNHALGIVFAAHGLTMPTPPVSDGVPHAIERNIAGANPLLRKH